MRPAVAPRPGLPTAPAVVVGRHQDAGVIDPAAATDLKWEILRRPTPGGVAYIDASAVCVEVMVPASHAQARADVWLATQWFGELIVAALRSVGIAAGVAAGSGSPVEGLAAAACFGSWVRGEVLAGGRKVFGVAQFRRQGHALFQGLALTAGRHGSVASALAGPVAERERAAAAIDEQSAVLSGVVAETVRESLCAALVRAGIPPSIA